MPSTLTPRPTPQPPATPQVAVYLGATRIDAIGAQYQDKDRDLGSFSFELLNTDTVTATIDFGDVVTFELDGATDFVGIVTDINPATVAEGEEASQRTTFSGTSIIGEWRHAIIRPATSFRVWPPGTPLDGLELGSYPFSDTRYFNWAEPSIDRTSWPAATALWQVSQFPPMPAPNGFDGAPEAWPHAGSWWVAPRAISGGAHPVGDWYWTETFTTDSTVYDVDVWAACAPDDSFELFLDGQPVIVSDRNEERETKPTRARVGVSAGTHRLVAKITHGYASSGDVTGFVCAVFKHKATNLRGPAGYLAAPLCYTSSANEVLDYPSTRPGLTIGATIRRAVLEAQARGVNATWALGFTATTDSSGAAWGDPIDVVIPVGKSVWELLVQLAESYIDFSIDVDSNGGRQLNVWKKGNRAASSGVSLMPGAVQSLTHHGTDDVSNDLVSRWDGGHARFEDDDSVTASGRREAFLSIPEVTDGRSAFYASMSTLAYLAVATESVEVEHRYAGDRYRVGETVETKDRFGATVDLEVKAVTVAADEDGQARIVAELGAARDELQDRADRYTRSVAHGTLDGRSEVAVPINASILSSQQIAPSNLAIGTGGGSTIVGQRGDTRRYDSPTLVTRLEIDCDTAASSTGSTTVRAEKDGVSIGTVTLPVGTRTGSTTLSPPVIFMRSHYANVETTVDGGHVGITVTFVGVPLQ